MRQVIANLVSNALKFTDAGSVQLAIDHQDGTLQFDVIDTGIGIPPESLDRLFDKFFQIDSSSTRRHDGTGLGLSITRALCELMGGRIWAEADRTAGAAFHVALPLPVAEPADLAARPIHQLSLIHISEPTRPY